MKRRYRFTFLRGDETWTKEVSLEVAVVAKACVRTGSTWNEMRTVSAAVWTAEVIQRIFPEGLLCARPHAGCRGDKVTISAHEEFIAAGRGRIRITNRWVSLYSLPVLWSASHQSSRQDLALVHMAIQYGLIEGINQIVKQIIIFLRIIWLRKLFPSWLRNKRQYAWF